MVLLVSPVFPFDFGIQFVDKPLPDLFSSFSSKHLREQFPVLAHFFHELSYSLILLS